MRGSQIRHNGSKWDNVKQKANFTYGLLRTTLIDKLNWKAPIGSNPGKQCILSATKESVLIDYLKLMSSTGYPLKRQELYYKAGILLCL